jgi:hypothetical protein
MNLSVAALQAKKTSYLDVRYVREAKMNKHVPIFLGGSVSDWLVLFGGVMLAGVCVAVIAL